MTADDELHRQMVSLERTVAKLIDELTVLRTEVRGYVLDVVKLESKVAVAMDESRADRRELREMAVEDRRRIDLALDPSRALTQAMFDERMNFYFRRALKWAVIFLVGAVGFVAGIFQILSYFQ